MARRQKATARCVRCGAKLERFAEDDRIILDNSVVIQEASPCLHKRDAAVGHDWYSASKLTLRSWRLCKSCADGAVEVLQEYMNQVTLMDVARSMGEVLK